MKFNLSEETIQRIKAYSISGIIIALAWFIIKQAALLGPFLQTMFKSLAPFIWGICFAFIMLPVRRIAEDKWMASLNWKKRTKRRVAAAISIIFLLLIIVAFFSVIIPQLVNSFQTLAASVDGYMNTIGNLLSKIDPDSEVSSVLNSLYTSARAFVTGLFSSDSQFLQTIMQYSMTLVKGVGNFFIGLIVSVYLLVDSERWKRQIHKLVYALFGKTFANKLVYVGRLTADMLNGFLFGKALDSLIIGVICGIVCGILKMPYTPLIAFTVGLTNMIPFFGPFIGAVPCFFILLIINPIKSLEFIIFILILQQVDGNILGPYILGDSLGLPALWVMFAILVGGSTFGIAGMILGVPVFSVFYVLTRDWSNKRLKEKDINLDE